jgi:hypothetical protein
MYSDLLNFIACTVKYNVFGDLRLKLEFRNWNRYQQDVQSNGYRSYDPKRLARRSLKPENQSKEYASQVSEAANDPGHHALSRSLV